MYDAPLRSKNYFSTERETLKKRDTHISPIIVAGGLSKYIAPVPVEFDLFYKECIVASERSNKDLLLLASRMRPAPSQ
jgi:hypothetical protein